MNKKQSNKLHAALIKWYESDLKKEIEKGDGIPTDNHGDRYALNWLSEKRPYFEINGMELNSEETRWCKQMLYTAVLSTTENSSTVVFDDLRRGAQVSLGIAHDYVLDYLKNLSYESIKDQANYDFIRDAGMDGKRFSKTKEKMFNWLEVAYEVDGPVNCPEDYEDVTVAQAIDDMSHWNPSSYSYLTPFYSEECELIEKMMDISAENTRGFFNMDDPAYITGDMVDEIYCKFVEELEKISYNQIYSKASIDA